MGVCQDKCTGVVHTTGGAQKIKVFVQSINVPKDESDMSGNDLIIPDEYCFQLNDDEFSNWKSQIVISNDNLNLKSQFATLEKWDSLRSQYATIEGRRGQHKKYLPYAFTPKQWIEKTSAIRFVSKAGRCRGTYGIAKCDHFKTVSGQQAVAQLTQIPWGHKFAIISKCGIAMQLATQIPWEHNIAIIPKCGNLKEVKMA